MSASQEKKARVTRRDEGTDKKQNAANEELLKAKKFRRNAIIAVVAIVVIVAAAAVINSNLFYTSLTAVKVGNTSYNAAEVDVFYRVTYNNLYSYYQSAYGDYASYFLPDSSTPLDQQQYSSDQTWADYLYEQTLDNMQQITALYDAAQADGYTLSEADQASIDSQVSMIETYASVYGYRSADHFLTANYGRGVTLKTYESVMTKVVTAQSYGDQVYNEKTYSTDELNRWYDAHADEYDYVNYYYYFVDSSNAAFDEIEDEDAKLTAARDAAAEIAKATDAESFADAVAAFSEGAAPSEQYLQGNSLSSYYSEWLLDSARKEGDTTVAETDSGAYAVLFIARDGNDYRLTSMRHILIRAEADEETGAYTDEAKEAAKARIEEIEAEWKANPTEDNFAALANQYSEDEGSNTNGGLYENIGKKQMVTNINDFLFDTSRTPGDTAVLYGESGAYSGWHLVYYVGEGAVYKDYLAENQLRSDDYSAYLENLTSGYEVTTGSGLRYANLS